MVSASVIAEALAEVASSTNSETVLSDFIDQRHDDRSIPSFPEGTQTQPRGKPEGLGFQETAHVNAGILQCWPTREPMIHNHSKGRVLITRDTLIVSLAVLSPF